MNKREYIIMTDSGCDLSEELINKLNVDVVPMSVMIDNKDYKHYPDYRELSKEDFYAKLKEGHIGKTSCVNVMDVKTAMEKHLKENKDVLYLSFSSGMSTSYQAARLASQELLNTYPEATINVVDTLSGCVGLGMLVYLVANKQARGTNIEDLTRYAKIECLNICHHFVVEDIKYIQKSGRISAFAGAFCSAIGVRPAFKLSDEGKVVLEAKVRGKKGVINHLLNKAKESVFSELFFIGHVDALENAKLLKQSIQTIYPSANIQIFEIGPVVGNNTGRGTLSVMFLGAER